MNTIASKSEALFYEIANAQDEFALTLACMKIPSVAPEDSPEYQELIYASASRRMELEQNRFSCLN